MKHSPHFSVAVLAAAVLFFALFFAACAPASKAAVDSTPEPTPTATPTETPAPTPMLSKDQKKYMIWMGEDYLTYEPISIFIFYVEHNGEGRIVWTTEESCSTSGEYDFYDVFNYQLLFHISIPTADQLKANPTTYPQYVTDISELFSEYTIVASGKLLDLEEFYIKNGIEYSEINGPDVILNSYLDPSSYGFSKWTKEQMISAYIDVTPTRNILAFWEYIPGAVTPDNFYNPPTPSPVPTPMQELTVEQKKSLLGINNKFSDCLLGSINTYYCKFNDKNYRFWTVSVLQEGSLKEDIYNIFNMQYLFTIDVPEEGTNWTSYYKYLGKTNPLLTGIELIHSSAIPGCTFYYDLWKIDYKNNEYFNMLNEKWWDKNSTSDELNQILDTPISDEKILELYLDTTPQEEIMPFWMFIPDATIPDELAGIFATSTVNPS